MSTAIAVTDALRKVARLKVARGQLTSGQLSYVSRRLNMIRGMRAKRKIEAIFDDLTDKYFEDKDWVAADIELARSGEYPAIFENTPVFRAFLDAQRNAGLEIDASDFTLEGLRNVVEANGVVVVDIENLFGVDIFPAVPDPDTGFSLLELLKILLGIDS